MAKTKKETRIERWLIELSDALEALEWRTGLYYDDRRGGDRLALSAEAGAAVTLHCELSIRRTRNGARLALFVSSRPAAERFAAAMAGMHHGVRRIDNAKRKFVHRIERMAENLEETFWLREVRYPRWAIDKLAKLFADARPMVGVEGRFRARGARGGEDSSGVQDRRMRRTMGRYRSAYAASVHAGSHRRAAAYVDGRGFAFAGEALTRLEGALATRHVGAEADYAVVNRIRRYPGEDEGDELDANGWDIGLDVVDANLCDFPDCDVVDLPDCDVIDLPDCDVCGGLDCFF